MYYKIRKIFAPSAAIVQLRVTIWGSHLSVLVLLITGVTLKFIRFILSLWKSEAFGDPESMAIRWKSSVQRRQPANAFCLPYSTSEKAANSIPTVR